MSVEARWPELDAVGRLRFAVVRKARKQDPEKKLFSGTVIGDQVHWDTWERPPLFPAEVEEMAKVLQAVAIEARKHQGRKERGGTDGPPSDTA
jgi:hypothetical protein